MGRSRLIRMGESKHFIHFLIPLVKFIHNRLVYYLDTYLDLAILDI